MSSQGSSSFVSMDVHLGAQTELEPKFPAPQPAALSVVLHSLKIRKTNIPGIEYRMFSIKLCWKIKAEI